MTIPLATLLGLADYPGDAVGFGPIDGALARTMATAAVGNPATTWCVTVTDQHGHPTAHGCARPGPRTGPQTSAKPGHRVTGRPHRDSERRHRATGRSDRATQ